jgi:hypothetical protein
VQVRPPKVFAHFFLVGLSFHHQYPKEVKNMKSFEELKAMVAGMEEDFEKFYEKGNKAAGTRVRKHMADLKRKAQEIRVEVQGMKQAEKKD